MKRLAVDRPDRGQRDDRGMVTAELAAAILAACAVLLLIIWGIYLMVMQVRCIDTAAEVARQAARGDAAEVARARSDAPPGAQVAIARSAGLIRVEVRLTARPIHRLGVAVPLRAHAEVVPEPEHLR